MHYAAQQLWYDESIRISIILATNSQLDVPVKLYTHGNKQSALKKTMFLNILKGLKVFKVFWVLLNYIFCKASLGVV